MTDDRAGFSLIEVLAALGVFSIGAMGLIFLNTHVSRSAQHIEARFLAQVTAENVMTDAMTQSEPLVIGVSEGADVQRRRNLSWRRAILPTERQGLLLLEVSVSDPATGQVLARLQALRREAR